MRPPGRGDASPTWMSAVSQFPVQSLVKLVETSDIRTDTCGRSTDYNTSAPPLARPMRR